MSAKPRSPALENRGVRLHASGRFRTGGVLTLAINGRESDRLELPGHLMALLLLLVLAAKRVAESGHPHHAFLTRRDIEDKLTERTSYDMQDDQRVKRLVHGLRTKLEQTDAAAIVGCRGRRARRAWARQLIEYRASFGYRLNLPPDNVSLALLSGRLPDEHGDMLYGADER